MPLEHWRELADTLIRHKMRTFLTAFGVIWGVFMLVMLLGITSGIENATRERFGAAQNAVFIWLGRPTSIPYKGLGKGRYLKMTDDDVAAIESLDIVEFVSPGNGIGQRTVSYGNQSQAFEIRGAAPAEKRARGFKMLSGRFLNDRDMQLRRKVTVIGDKAAVILFGKNGIDRAIGETITVFGSRALVVGVFKPTAMNDWAARFSEHIYLPLTTFRQAFNQGNQVYFFIAVPKEGSDAVAAEKIIEKRLKERHFVHPNDYGVIGSYNAQKNFDQVMGTFTGVKLFGWLVAIGTILSGVIGVGNIMLISVKERTREIGLRKAVGATPLDIVKSIIIEASCLSLAAGYIGLLLGVVGLAFLDQLSMRSEEQIVSNPTLHFTTALLAVLVLFIASLLTSWLPARKAALVDPIKALQSA